MDEYDFELPEDLDPKAVLALQQCECAIDKRIELIKNITAWYAVEIQTPNSKILQIDLVKYDKEDDGPLMDEPTAPPLKEDSPRHRGVEAKQREKRGRAVPPGPVAFSVGQMVHLCGLSTGYHRELNGSVAEVLEPAGLNGRYPLRIISPEGMVQRYPNGVKVKVENMTMVTEPPPGAVPATTAGDPTPSSPMGIAPAIVPTVPLMASVQSPLETATNISTPTSSQSNPITSAPPQVVGHNGASTVPPPMASVQPPLETAPNVSPMSPNEKRGGRTSLLSLLSGWGSNPK